MWKSIHFVSLFIRLLNFILMFFHRFYSAEFKYKTLKFEEVVNIRLFQKRLLRKHLIKKLLNKRVIRILNHIEQMILKIFKQFFVWIVHSCIIYQKFFRCNHSVFIFFPFRGPLRSCLNLVSKVVNIDILCIYVWDCFARAIISFNLQLSTKFTVAHAP